MIANVATRAAQRLELRHRRLDPRATGDEAGGNIGERGLQRGIGQRRGDPRLEVSAPLHDAPRDAGRASGGASISPASTSATWRQAIGEPCRDSFPATFRRQPSSPDSISSAPRCLAALGLGRDHGIGDVGKLHREQPAETAAGLGARHLDQLQSRHGGEQAARLLLDLQLAQARAAVMVGHAAREAARHRRHAAHVDEERDELVHAFGEGACAPLGFIVAGHEARIVQLEHRRARPGRRHDVVEAVERRDRLQGDGAGAWRLAAVVGWLAAARLRPRHDHLAACGLQQPHGGKADGGTHHDRRGR